MIYIMMFKIPSGGPLASNKVFLYA